MQLRPGLEGHAETMVEAADTALEVCSGDLRVYATPCLAAMMEGAACACLEGLLPEDQPAPVWRASCPRIRPRWESPSTCDTPPPPPWAWRSAQRLSSRRWRAKS